MQDHILDLNMLTLRTREKMYLLDKELNVYNFSSAEKAAARGGACGDGSVGKLRLGLAELRAAASNGERAAPCREATA